MKAILSVIILAFATTAWAETVDIKDVDIKNGNESTTTIEIKKGKPGAPAAANQWETTDGNADVEGEAGATNKTAKANWKKSCEDWKKEIRAENKENKVISLNCGAMNCAGEAGAKVCTSKSAFKIKTRVN